MAKIKDLLARWILPNCGCLAPAIVIGLVFVLVMLSLNEGGLRLFGTPTFQNIGGVSSGVPEPYKSLFIKAGEKYDTPPALIAAVFCCGEHGGSWPDPKGPWATSNKGAKGPFQFIDSTWSQYGVDGDGDGIKDVQNLTDAAYSASNYLGANIRRHYGTMKRKIKKAIWAYNHDNGYVEKVYKCFLNFMIITKGELFPPLGNYTLVAGQNRSPHTVTAQGHGLFISLHNGVNSYGNGIDWFTKNDEEKPVYAVSNGIIERIKEHNSDEGYGYGGWYVYIYNKETKIESLYAHIYPISGLKEGQEIRKGEQIGVIYSKKRQPPLGFKTSGAHLHFQLWINGDGQSQKQIMDYLTKKR